MVTGRGALYLTDAAARSDKIRGYSLHHEQSAVFAASAYADYSEKSAAVLCPPVAVRPMHLQEF